MKTNNYKPVALSNVIYAFCLLFVTLFLSCDKDNDEKDGYFELTDSASELEASAQGASETYTFRSSGNWKIEALRKEKWVKISPEEGSGDGTFTLTVARNITPEDRSVVLTFMVDGRLQSNVFKIEQKSSTSNGEEKDPYLMLDDLTSLEIPETGATSRHTIRSTGAWKVALSDQEADWVTMEPMEGTGDTPVVLTVGKNSSAARSVNLNFYLDDVLQANVLPINQAEARAILNEDFSWLTYGSPIFYTTDDEARIDNWTTEEKAKGWTSTINMVDKSGETPLVYARSGFVKLGKTSYGGDLISPKLTAVQGVDNLLVKFKAVPYQTKAGTRDDTLLKVEVIGPGEVSVKEFNITNWPDYDADPTCTAIWEAAETERSFVITGATAETQIRFLGNDFDLRSNVVPINKNRIFLDDIVVTVQK